MSQQANVVVDFYRVRSRGKMAAPEEVLVDSRRAGITHGGFGSIAATMSINGERIQLPVVSMGDGSLRIVVNIVNPGPRFMNPRDRFVDQEIGS